MLSFLMRYINELLLRIIYSLWNKCIWNICVESYICLIAIDLKIKLSSINNYIAFLWSCERRMPHGFIWLTFQYKSWYTSLYSFSSVSDDRKGVFRSERLAPPCSVGNNFIIYEWQLNRQAKFFCDTFLSMMSERYVDAPVCCFQKNKGLLIPLSAQFASRNQWERLWHYRAWSSCETRGLFLWFWYYQRNCLTIGELYQEYIEQGQLFSV